MSDFLMRLTERTLCLAPVVRPIIAPMFAKGPAIQNGYSSESTQDNESQSYLDKTETNHAQEILPAFPRYSLIPDLISRTHASLADSSSRTQGPPLRKTPGSLFVHHHSDSNPGSLKQAKDSTSHAITGQNNMGISVPTSKPMSPEDLPDSKRLKESILSLNEPVDKSVDKTLPEQAQNKSLSREHLFDAYRDVSKPQTDSDRSSSAALQDAAEVPDTRSAKISALKPYAPVDKSADKTLPEQAQNKSLSHEHLFDAPEPKIDSDQLSSTVLRDTTEVPDTQSAKISALKPHVPVDRAARIGSQSMAAPKSFSSMPTIKVTIGRVEVRAIMQSKTPATRVRQSSPTLSLDDYLKQRKGG